MKIKDLTYLVALSPLAFLPFMSDPTPSGMRGAEVQSDTTYLSTGYSAYLVPIYADTVVQYPDTFILGGPDQDSVPSGTPGRWYQGPGDSMIFLSYRITDIPATEKDSTFIDSVWADWGLGIPYAYNANVPGAQLPFDTVGSLVHINYESYESDSAYVNDPKWLFVFTPERQFIDTWLPHTGLTRSVRYDWVYSDTLDMCDHPEKNNGVEYEIPGGKVAPYYREVWVETAVRVSPEAWGLVPGWVDCDIGQQGAWKMWHSWNGIGRWLVTAWNSGGWDPSARWRLEAPEAGGRGHATSGFATGDQLMNDNEWHKVRFWVKMSTDSFTADGHFSMWLDSLLMGPDTTAWQTDDDTLHISPEGVGVDRWDFGRNKDKGGYSVPNIAALPHTESWWTAYTTIWVSPDTPAWFPDLPKPRWTQGASPTFVWDFSEFEDTDAMWAWDNSEGINILNDNEDHTTTIDLTDGYGSSDRSFKQTFTGYPAADTLNRCVESSTGFELTRTKWDEIVCYTNDEFYWELAIKWDENWTPLPDICELNPDHKLFRLIFWNEDYNWTSSISLKIGNFASQLFVPNAPDKYDGSTNNAAANSYSIIPWVDGEWHTIRFGGKRSSAKGVKDGHWWASIDSGGTRIPILPDGNEWGDSMDIWWDTIATWQTAPYFGRNRHIMPEGDDQSYYFGQLKIYDASPKWLEFPGGPDFEGQ